MQGLFGLLKESGLPMGGQGHMDLGQQAAMGSGAVQEVSGCGSRLKVGQTGTSWGHKASAGGGNC